MSRGGPVGKYKPRKRAAQPPSAFEHEPQCLFCGCDQIVGMRCARCGTGFADDETWTTRIKTEPTPEGVADELGENFGRESQGMQITHEP